MVKTMDLKNLYDGDRDDYGNSWLITYSDMITIILCFFIVFFTFSAEETSMLEGIKESLTLELEDLTEENQALKKEKEELKKVLIGDPNKKSPEDFMAFLENKDLLNSVYIDEGDSGIVIRFKDGVLFSSGQANISQEGLEILEEVGNKLVDLPNLIIVEGFTDNRPIKYSAYNSNWELSSARAIGVAKYFIEELNISEDRISVSGFGEQRPIDTNDTEEGRSNNRRIEITILN